ncbi:response regulator [uncultured Arcticibacterium sp.]|uniref:response regulator n=1 Tax=uncultured Arcticibacterium sp. TaxID=2173042 RepID=UPI0030F9701D
MNTTKLNILLADDDEDDCEFFSDALNEISPLSSLTILNDGVQLMNFLAVESESYPDVIFLDLNMPKKSGMECITEIKAIDKLKNIPIVVSSTSLDSDVVNTLYELGTHFYIKKPGAFNVLKKVINEALVLISVSNLQQPSSDKFVIQP